MVCTLRGQSWTEEGQRWETEGSGVPVWGNSRAQNGRTECEMPVSPPHGAAEEAPAPESGARRRPSWRQDYGPGHEGAVSIRVDEATRRVGEAGGQRESER